MPVLHFIGVTRSFERRTENRLGILRLWYSRLHSPGLSDRRAQGRKTKR